MQRVMLTLPADLLSEVDSLAQRTRRKRSQLLREAFRDLLERERQADFAALLAEGYQAQAAQIEQTAADAGLAQAAGALWAWDE
jgi:metal-responsive CopG/Arc/MetJ family transcriptional regulator